MTNDLDGHIRNGRHYQRFRIYYEDTDFPGFVYHANYLKFCERGRSDFLRLLGIHHHQLHDAGNGAGFVVRRMVCEFMRPVRIDDIIEVSTGLVEARGARMQLDQQISRNEEILFEAQVTAALVDGRGRPARFPSDMLKALRRVQIFAG